MKNQSSNKANRRSVRKGTNLILTIKENEKYSECNQEFERQEQGSFLRKVRLYGNDKNNTTKAVHVLQRWAMVPPGNWLKRTRHVDQSCILISSKDCITYDIISLRIFHEKKKTSKKNWGKDSWNRHSILNKKYQMSPSLTGDIKCFTPVFFVISLHPPKSYY